MNQPPALYTGEAHASPVLKHAIARRATRTFIIKSSAKAEKLVDELKQLYTHAWDEQSRHAVARALDRLQDMPSTISATERQHIYKLLADDLGGEALLTRLRQPIINLTDTLFRAGAAEVVRTMNFNRPDLAAIDVITQGNLYWIKDSSSASGEIISRHLDTLFRDGMTRGELSARLARSTSSLVNKGSPYFDMLADHTATKTRELGRITGYEKAGITYVRVQAYLDARTSAVCRCMHGRVMKVSRLIAQKNNTLAALKQGDYDGVKKAWNMHVNNKSLAGQSTANLKHDTACPPYHLRCRTITIAYQPQAGRDDTVETVERKTYNRERLSKQELRQLVERVKDPKWRDVPRRNKHYGKHAAQDGLATEQYEADLRNHITKPDAIYIVMYGTDRHATAQVAFVKRYTNGQLHLTAVDIETKTVRTSHVRDSGDVNGWLKEPKNAAIVQQTGGRLLKWLWT